MIIFGKLSLFLFIKKKPVNLNILVSIMLVYLENNEIVDEYIF